ncbi:jg20883 [Pararge aegeria aegeria]|uniref:Jg20883 protein n=1 Tax=Pararge aegeria aegeria TaxID=348720 RepID=A0A8S4RHD7_9NEOP|nr:jg20883 [Pararge aegeria aegeria]
MSTAARLAKVSLKPIEVPKALLEGEKFVRWDEDSGTGLPVTLRVDPNGFFLYWTDQNMEVDMLDMAAIRDVRTGVYAKLPKEVSAGYNPTGEDLRPRDLVLRYDAS